VGDVKVDEMIDRNDVRPLNWQSRNGILQVHTILKESAIQKPTKLNFPHFRRAGSTIKGGQ
jgi:hypothetical protein